MQSITSCDGEPDASGDRPIPIPDVPLGPVLSLASFFPRRRAAVPAVVDGGPALPVTAGRAAIALALRALKVPRGAKVLVPAYHCATMVSPLSWVGAEPVFFRVRDDLSVDLSDIAEKSASGARTLLVAHYFGFAQDMPAIRQFCDERGLSLIEDCAHAFFGEIAGRPIGSFGDFAAASPRKFFASTDGGCLVSSRHPLPDWQPVSRPFVAETIAAWRLADAAITYGRLPAIRPLQKAADAVRRIARRRPPGSPAASDGPDNSGATTAFDGDMTHAMASFSRWVCHHASRERAVTRRRENYRRLADGLSDVPGCRPLKPILGERTVPYMFPLWVDDLRRLFPLLEDAATPMQRFGQFLWPGVDAATCAVTARLSRHVVQLACHQELTEEEIDSVVARVRAAMATFQ